MIFTTRNNELAILGNTVDNVKNKLIFLADAYEQSNGKFSGDGGILSILSNNKKSNSAITPELLGDFEAFRDLFNSTSLSAEVLAEDLGGVDQRIVNYAKDCKNGELKQNNFISSLEGMTFSAKAGKIALQGLALAGNMIVMWGISTIISHVTEKIKALSTESETAEKQATGFANSLNDSFGDISNNFKTLSDLNEEYQKLAKGVNVLGENVSLTTNEYDRYKTIIDQVSNIMPNMTTFFNAQGEQIAFAEGKLSDLNSEYQKYLENKAKDFLTNGDEEGNTVQDVIDNLSYNYTSKNFLENLETSWNWLNGDFSISDLPSDVMISSIENLLGMSQSELADYLKDVDPSEQLLGFGDNSPLITALTKLRISDVDNVDRFVGGVLLEVMGVTTDEIANNPDIFNSVQQKMSDYIDSLENSNEVDMSKMTSTLFTIAYGHGYFALDESVQKNVASLLSAIDYDTWTSITRNDASLNEQVNLESYISRLIDDINSNKDGVSTAWNSLFSPELEALPFSEYEAQANEYIDIVAKALGLDEAGTEAFKLSLGFDFSTTNGVIDRLKSDFDDVGDAWVDTLTKSELELAASDEFNTELELQKANLEGATLSATDYATALENVKAAQKDAANPNDTSLSSWLRSSYSSEETNSDRIENWKSQIGELQTLLNDINSGNKSITAGDAIAQFPDLQPYVEQYNDLSIAVSAFMRDSYTELVRGFGDTSAIDGFSYQLEYLQNILNEGLGGSNNIQQLKAAYEELTGVLERVQNNQRFSAEEISDLISRYDGLNNSVSLTTDGYQIEEAAITSLIDNYVTLSNTAVLNQTALTQELLNQIKIRVNAWGIELEAMKKIASIYNNTHSEKAVADYLYSNYGANLTSATPAIIKEALNYSEASAELDSLLAQLENSYTNNQSTASAETDYAALLDKETSLLEKQLDANLITFSDYLDKRKSLLDDYYTAGKITTEEYYDGLSSLYESQLSTYDKVIGAVTNRIDKEINSLEKQKEVIEESYRFKIDAVQAEIDALNKENEARKKQIALEQAQYEAERARNQRSIKQFVNGQFIYTADMDEVKAAKENLAEQEQQMEISLLEDQIASLEQEMENATASLDNQISALEAYKEQWSEISSVYEEQQNALITAEILGADWETQVLNGRLEALQNFTTQYIALQQAQANAAALSAKIGLDAKAGISTLGSVGTTPAIEYLSPKALKDIPVYHNGLKGGYVGAPEKTDDKLKLLLAATEDHLTPAVPALLQQGELVLTSSQQDNLAATLMRNSMDYGSLAMQDYVAGGFDFSKLPSTTQSVVQNINLTLPNITNQTGYENLRKELHQMQIDARQRAYRH